MRYIIAVGLLAFAAACSGTSSSDSAAAEPRSKDQVEAAVAVAQQWVALVDAGKYEDSWDASAQLFQKNVTRESWGGTVAGVREPLGVLKTRAVKSAKYTTTAPGAPDGEYVVVQFDTSFANKAVAVETITPMRAADGSWRVSGYYIR